MYLERILLNIYLGKIYIYIYKIFENKCTYQAKSTFSLFLSNERPVDYVHRNVITTFIVWLIYHIVFLLTGWGMVIDKVFTRKK